MTPVVSVIIPCHNSAATLGLQLEALAAQREAPAFEVIVVDNRSTDKTVDVALAWKDRVPGLAVVDASDEQGAAYARNVGVAHSSADLLMFCDSDDVVSQWWIAHGVRSFSHAIFWSGAAVPIRDDFFSSDVLGARLMINDTAEWMDPSPQEESAFPILMGCNFGLSRSTFIALRGFDQSMGSAGEDNELAMRAKSEDVAIYGAPAARIAFRTRSDQRAVRRIAFRAGFAHAILATRYRVWRESPLRAWWMLLPRCVGAAMKMCLSPENRDWPGLSTRTAMSAGVTLGALRCAVFRRTPPRRVAAELNAVV